MVRVIALVLLLSGCSYVETFINSYGKDAASDAFNAARYIECEVTPVGTVLRELVGQEFIDWMENCNHSVKGFRIVPDEAD